MSHRLREHGFGIVGWDGAADRNKALAASGLRIAANPRALAAEAEIVISIITEDHGVRHIFNGVDGFLAGDVKRQAVYRNEHTAADDRARARAVG